MFSTPYGYAAVILLKIKYYKQVKRAWTSYEFSFLFSGLCPVTIYISTPWGRDCPLLGTVFKYVTEAGKQCDIHKYEEEL